MAPACGPQVMNTTPRCCTTGEDGEAHLLSAKRAHERAKARLRNCHVVGGACVPESSSSLWSDTQAPFSTPPNFRPNCTPCNRQHDSVVDLSLSQRSKKIQYCQKRVYISILCKQLHVSLFGWQHSYMLELLEQGHKMQLTPQKKPDNCLIKRIFLPPMILARNCVGSLSKTV